MYISTALILFYEIVLGEWR